MAYKAHRHLLRHCGLDAEAADVDRAVQPTTAYNSVIGNSYTASMYLGLAALLDSAVELNGRAVGRCMARRCRGSGRRSSRTSSWWAVPPWTMR
ncbi:hypothetical protein [Salinispora mooreana]|uniref:hypothetical protein n=1 Tax=Salinispora mooreana TaxID=999545 RepID=UPI000360FE65|nr:hypothetical protein [Salinispora mooreana]